MVNRLNSPGLQFPDIYKTTKTGALESFRTGQPLDDKDIRLINQIPTTVAEWPNGSKKIL